MKNFLIIGMLVLFGSLNCFAIESTGNLSLKEFKTDGCTMYPDGTRKQPKLWRHCCVEHDLRYWFGGDKVDEQIADLRLKKCVAKAAGNFQAKLMYTGIRLGHYSPIKNKTRWSWGWNHQKSYSSLSAQEKEVAKASVEALVHDEISQEMIVKFVRENFPDLY